MKTFEIRGYKYYTKYNGENEFNKLIPNTVAEIIFTDEIKPESAGTIDVDADGDGGVIAWTENDNTVMKVSTQIKGVKVQAAKDSSYMFYNCNNLIALDLSQLDTQNMTDMNNMFYGCSGLTSLNLSTLDTHKVTDMSSMFYKCSGLTALDLSTLDTQNVTRMNSMFSICRSLTTLDLSSFKMISGNSR